MNFLEGGVEAADLLADKVLWPLLLQWHELLLQWHLADWSVVLCHAGLQKPSKCQDDEAAQGPGHWADAKEDVKVLLTLE
eukprot:774373-Amphidinium_carterae.1